ncbi:uracil-DNA glycosylase [Bacillus carboniphilus]|uniref:Uracil-DNA glycosylase n=1 Tax=Bacillus carboniphilus TaxID=86663 RepID=A0ABY9JQT4_9BACI|nr:uracil-DNA glycosylase [Bacillus carboniphilus]WLR41766.1 uracil-DNA glycosylase [Bacillus carboniphilus]
MFLEIENDWFQHLKRQLEEPYYQELMTFIKHEYETEMIYPQKDEVFTAFKATPLEKVKVVILGQDPYHQPNQAHGLSFSVKKGIKLPPSLRSIFKERENDLGIPFPKDGCLLNWAEQGVFLLNTVLTVREGEPYSHRNKGWERFTDEVIKLIDQKNSPVVFVLWGKHAQNKKEMIDKDKHFVLESPHPSPLSASRGFFGSHPFSKANAYLKETGQTPIDW